MISLRNRIIPYLTVNSAFILYAVITRTVLSFILLAFFAAASCLYMFIGDVRKPFDPKNKTQKAVFGFIILLIIVFSYFICIISVEAELVYNYPLEKVDDYGCYPQMFDAFKKHRLDIDTEADLSKLSALKNPYDPAQRRHLSLKYRETVWDRAFYDGKLYSYFGIAPVIFIYFPFYFLTGKLPSDALAAAILCAIAAIFSVILLYELVSRLDKKPSFAFFVYCALTLPFASLIWQILTCANFYHIAVISGIASVCAFFVFVLRAERAETEFKRKLLFALAGGTVAATVASRPNQAIYVLIALPLLFGIIKNRPRGTKSLIFDITAFILPMLIFGSLIALYNFKRFGSPFDFGSAYQITVTDTKNYTFSLALIPAALFHYFFQPPQIKTEFPYMSPSLIKPLFIYSSIDRYVYVYRTVGAIFFPSSWGLFFGKTALKGSSKTKKLTAIAVAVSVFAVAVTDMLFGGVHLRYEADILFVISITALYFLLSANANAKTDKRKDLVAIFGCIFLALTVILSLSLTLNNERRMILNYHTEFYNRLT